MKIALFEHGDGRRRLGVVEGDHVADLTSWLGPLGSCPLATFLGRTAKETPLPSGQLIPLSEVTWLPPALGSAAPLCVGVNYADHARLVAQRSPAAPATAASDPALFTRYWSSLTGHGRPIVRPAVSGWLDFEGELVVVIGQHCKAVPRERALDVVAGYTVGQEGTVRDWQRRARTPAAGKNFQCSGALGPWMVSADEVPDPAALRLLTTLNGEVVQDAPVSALIHDVPALIEHITTFMPLAPGDVIFTGTPAGTLSDRGNDRWLTPGDVVSVEIAGVGTLTNEVVDEVQTSS